MQAYAYDYAPVRYPIVAARKREQCLERARPGDGICINVSGAGAWEGRSVLHGRTNRGVGMNQPTNAHELAVDHLHADAERVRAFSVAANYLEQLAEDALSEARCEKLAENWGSAITEHNHARAYSESARALRAAVKRGGL